MTRRAASGRARPWSRLYSTARWKRLRARQLASEPLCCMCGELGRVTEATVADHKVPHKGDEVLFFNARNLQSLCKTHHDSSKAKQEARGVEAIGCGQSGQPLDPKHHWNS